MECAAESDHRVTQLSALPYLQSILAQQDTYAVVSQDTSGNITISAEIGAGPSDLAVPPLVGGQGPSGVAQFPLRPQTDVYTSPALLADEQPELTNTIADIGKFWIIDQQDDDGNCISSAAYIWFGTQFRVLPFGTEGPPGPYPVIAPKVTLIGPDETSVPNVNEGSTGSAANPYVWTLGLSVPEGPQGPSATLASMGDVVETTPPNVGQFLGFNGSYNGDELPIWQPIDSGDILPRPYTVPRGAFSAYSGITFESTVTVATFSVPPNPFPWKPLVFGQIEMFGAELDSNPLLIGAEVMLGSPTGTLVARGFGNSLGGVVTLVPHCSTPGEPTVQMTPTNSVGLVEANAEAVLYVNIVNDGIVALFNFQPAGAELFVMACAVTPQTPTPIPAAFASRITLSAKTITLGS